MILSNILDETMMSSISLGLSILTIIASGLVFWRYDRRINKQNIRINEFTLREQKEKEEDSRKAVIEVSHYYNGRGNGEVIIANVGKSDARNLTMEIDEDDDSGIFWLLDNLFPYRCLTPGSSIKLHYGLSSGFQKDPVVTFEWDDDFSNKRSSRHSVFLG